MLTLHVSFLKRKSYWFAVALFVMVVAAFVLITYTKGGEHIVISNTGRVSFLTTLYRNQTVYQEAFDMVEKTFPQGTAARAVITSHHLLAAPLIARSYRAVARDDITRIILVSPDHFQTSFPEDVLAFTTDAPWEALFGDITADKTYIASLTQEHKEIANNKNPFLSEHGIYTEIPFIRHYFPQAKVVPLILKNNYNYADFEQLGDILAQSVPDPGKTLLVVSSDFSHHATHTTAQSQDRESIAVLQNLTDSKFDYLNNDCRSCIALLAGYLKGSNTPPSFHLIERKDSTDFGGPDKDVTSYISGYLPFISAEERPFGGERKESDSGVTIIFGGDMMFDRSIRIARAERGEDFLFAPLRELLSGADVVVANLEGPITDNISVSVHSIMGEAKNYVFTFPPETAQLLKKEHIDIVNLGNNHILNFHNEGALQTKKYLEAAGVEYFGSPLAGDERVLYKEWSGHKMAFVNYNQFILEGKEKAFADIKQARAKADVVVLYTHWGKEYVPALPSIKDLAHQFIEAGVDVIIGSHPHVVEEKEVYAGKTIYYSLGNLIFDQYHDVATMHGLMVKMTVTAKNHELSFEDIPVVLAPTGQTMLDK